MQRLISKTTQGRFAHALASACCTLLVCWSSNVMAAAAPAPSIAISQIPLTVSIPAHPQILLALANSESMDGDLSGAIRTGSGSIAHPLLFPTSSPVNFTIPAGFTPPLNPGAAGLAPYTVNSGGVLYDNSPSRLNVAKAGLSAVLNAYIDSADFALIDYKVGGLTQYTTWVYQMSNPGGFTFTNTIPASGEYVLNPCFGVNIALAVTTAQNCKALNTFYASQSITTQQYMLVSSSSDDPSVNDVLYAGGLDAVCMVYTGPSPPSPFGPPFSLAAYKAGGVSESYSNQVNSCARTTGPTNAGFVPFSTQVMYEMRGFGYYTTSETANDGNPVVFPFATSGAIPDAVSVAAAIARFTPFLAPETNSTGTQEIKASATQSPMAGLMARAQTIFAGNPATTNGCISHRYVVLVTDGLPTMDLNHNNWPPLGSTAAAGYGVTAAFNADGSLAIGPRTNDQALIDVITNLTALNSGANPVQTYIIGVGAGVDPTKNPAAAATLTAMSIAGGTGTYFPATSPQAVTDALQTIITRILAVTESTASAAVNTTGLNVNSVVYQSQFVTSDTYQDWTGNVLAYPINSVTGVIDTALADIHWSAQTQLDAQSSRLIATWDPVTGRGIPFQWTAGTPASGIAGNTTLGTALQTFAPDPNGSDVVQYLRGSTAQEQRNGGKFRNRAHILGDIVDSNPAYIGPSAENLQSTSYRIFEATTAHRPPLLYIGGNDGMLHAFDTVTGNERFAYMPRGSYANLVNLVSPFYNAQHKFFVNGSPQAADVQFSDLTWHSLLVGTEAQGGNSVFALDITDPTSMTTEATVASKVLWDIVDTDLGLGFSAPAIANTNAGWKVIIGNGYNSTNKKPFLYVIDPQYGTNTKIDLCAAVTTACDLTASNGLSGVIAVNTSGAVTAAANIIYAGDLQGNLWRVDISNANPTLWVATVMFQARDASGNKQPITTKPVATLNPRFPQVLGTLVMFGTGQYLGVPDISNGRVQSMYGVYDPPAGYSSAINRSNLLPQTLATATLGSLTVRTTSGTAPSYPANKGWYMDLNLLSGERVINTPALFSGGELIFTTFQPIPPAAGVCTTLGSSFLMVLNFASGQSFTTPQFDANGDGHIGAGDMVTVSGITYGVAGVGLGSVYASGVTNLNGSVGGGSGLAIVTVTSLPNGGTSYVDPAAGGPPKARKAWWEIRQ
jgi:type IV pilus assembly protein PilY1